MCWSKVTTNLNYCSTNTYKVCISTRCCICAVPVVLWRHQLFPAVSLNFNTPGRWTGEPTLTLNDPLFAFPIAVRRPWTTTTSSDLLPPAGPDPQSDLHRSRLWDRCPEMIFNLCIWPRKHLSWSVKLRRWRFALWPVKLRHFLYRPDGKRRGTS